MHPSPPERAPSSARALAVFSQTTQPSSRMQPMQPQMVNSGSATFALPAVAPDIQSRPYSGGYPPQQVNNFVGYESEYPPPSAQNPYPNSYASKTDGIPPSSTFYAVGPNGSAPYPHRPEEHTEKSPAYPPTTVTIGSGQTLAGPLPPAPPGVIDRVRQAERSVRMGFIRKVYVLLMMQLVVTFSVVAIFSFVPRVKQGVQAHPGVLWAAIALSIVFLIALSCFPTIAKRSPSNIICLAGFTVTEAYLLGAIASYSGSDAVILAIGGTALLTVGLTLFTWQTRINFTSLTSSLFVVLWTLIFFAIVVAVAPSLILRTLFACLGVLLFGLFLVYDTEMVIGKGAAQYDIDDAISAALMLYVDIIQMFLCLLSLFGARD